MSKNLFFKVDIEAIQNGLIVKLGGVKHFAVMSAIAAFANGKGEAFPSQDTIARMVGYSRKTVNQIVGDLRETVIGGEPIIRIVQEKTPTGRRNKYILSKHCGLWFGSGNVTETNDNVTNSGIGVVTTGLQELEPYELEPNKNKNINIIFDNAKSVLDYFRQQYFNKYKVAYQPNYSRDGAMIKNKLLKNYTDNEIKIIVDTVFEEYDKRWAKPQFPRPSIGQLCSWLANEALAIAAKKKDEADRIEAEQRNYEMNDDAFEKLLKDLS